MYSSKPKVLHALAGRALVQHVVDTARELNPNSICVVYGHGGDVVPATLAAEGLSFALQEPQLGTGHAVQQAMPAVLAGGGKTLVLYGDVPLTSLATLHKLLAAPEDCLSLLTLKTDTPTGYGRIVRNLEGKVTAIVEEKDATEEQRQITEVNTGILAAPTAKLNTWLSKLQNHNAQSEYYLTDIIAMAASEGVEIHTSHPMNNWEVLGVNNKHQLADLERILQREQAEQLMQAGVTLADPARIDIRGKLTCGRDVEIDVGCIFEGDVTLGDGVKIGAYSVIRQSALADGVQVAPYTHIDQAKIGKHCLIGPYARLRPGTTLHDAVHVGNFVEIKNSEIADQSKANHLSYIGDSTVGSRVNIGAGTITCNYDGANKHRTIIEDDAFIGSDTQLVAPVTVGKGATIGAGSTITRDTPPGELTLSRSKQVTINGWKRPQKGKK